MRVFAPAAAGTQYRPCQDSGNAWSSCEGQGDHLPGRVEIPGGLLVWGGEGVRSSSVCGYQAETQSCRSCRGAQTRGNASVQRLRLQDRAGDEAEAGVW